MKKLIVLVICLALVMTLAGCRDSQDTGGTMLETYYEQDDGTWCCNDIEYMYRLEIKGRVPNAAYDSVYIYLSNIPEITFEQAWKASGLSSNSEDYFTPEEAVLVEMRTEE